MAQSAIIEHLSKDIMTLTETMMTFRTRVGFTVFIGPFVMLGSFLVASKGQPQFGELTGERKLLALGLFVVYLTLGYVCGRIERGAWDQCNSWRQLISKIDGYHSPTALPRELMEEMEFRQKRSPQWMVPTYVFCFGLFFVSFVLLVWLISGTGTPLPS